MNDTKKRIKALKAALPDLRERVIAVALMLAMSLAMVTSASFAWLTISRAPEVSSINTNVAANGNLEIALVPADGSQPAESAIGDSSATQGQSVVAANLTWGNLVNLSDASYGLDHLTLRPAQLNQAALLTSPLYGAEYDDDGRISLLSSSFAYTTWQPPEGNVPGYFLVTDDYGIRAISSTTVEAVGFAQQVLEKRNAAENANTMAGSSYLNITQNRTWMNSLATIMGTYMTARLNSSNPSMANADIINTRDMFAAFIDVYEEQIDAMVKLANYQLFLLHNSESGSTPYTEYSAQTLLATTEANLKKEGIQLEGLNQLKTDYANLQSSYEELCALADAGSTTYDDVSPIVNKLVNVGTCTISGSKMTTTTINGLAGDKSNAVSAVTNGGINGAQITNGVLFNFEKLNGAHCKVEDMRVSATFIITLNLTVDITTTAPQVSQFSTSLVYADSLNQGAQGVEVAQDTYGLAIDLWVRTNAPDSYLTLEGNVLTETEHVPATGTNAEGETVELYVLNFSDDEGNSFATDVYKNAEGNWYYADSHTQVPEEELTTIPIAKTEEVVHVLGYEGENRIWEDNSLLSIDSTSQGSGSCYVYYADTPEDQARSLALLDSMYVAFVDDAGALLATAEMDTERFYAENGRVTVPLMLTADSLSLGEGEDGQIAYAITPLEKNVAKRITAIVYLDGTVLTNKDVLAASDIQGKLNIQFGSSKVLSHAEDEALMGATRSVSAALSANSFSYDTAIETGTPMKTTVTVTVDGDKPENVTAFFLRAISSSQGSREEVMTFTDNGDGTWSADYTFTAPGSYVLRSVDLDGSTYDLKQPQTVTVEGFTVESLTCVEANQERHVSVMTEKNATSVNVRLKFASDKVEAMPSTVSGRFLRSDGTASNVTFTYNANTGFWEGKANFVSSGTYTLQYLVLDGEYTELAESMWQTAEIYLGMKVAVYTDSPTKFLYMGSGMPDNQQNLYMKVKILDNTGAEMRALSGAELFYAKQGSDSLEKGLSTPLTWNATSGYYEGTFPSRVGRYNFSTVTVGGSTISLATVSPSFQITSPIPPTFDSANTAPYQYAPNNNAVLSVLINDAESATVWADIVDEDGKTYEQEGYLNSNGSWVFDVPKDAEGKQDGIWTIQQIRIWDAYDISGNEYTEEAPLIFSMAGEANVTAKVVSTVTVTVTPAADKDLGKDDSGSITAFFLDTQSVTGLSVSITDFEGAAVADQNGSALISNVKLIYNYGGQSQAYGGYTSTAIAPTDAMYTVTMNVDSTGTVFSQSEPLNVQYAGVYTPVLKYTINGVEYTMTAAQMGNSAPTFNVWSKTPYVKFTATNPAAGNTFTGANEAANGTVDRQNVLSADGYSVTVYYQASGNSNGCGGGSCSGYTASRATLGLFDAGINFSNATVTITSKGNGSDVVYSFTPGTAAATLYNEQQLGSASGTTRNGIGSGAQGTAIVITISDGTAFTVNLANAISATAQY